MQNQDTFSQAPVVVVGVGELGAVFARGFLRSGYTVVPVNRDTSMDAVAQEHEAPLLVLVAVGEVDLPAVLAQIPEAWRDRLVLIQNELLPASWAAAGIENPTVASVWFEKKAGQDSKVIIPTPITGPHAPVVEAALGSIGIAARVVSETEMVDELVVKNLYILTSNIGGLDLPAGTTVGQLWSDHRDHAEAVLADVAAIQEALVGSALDRERLTELMVVAFNGDPDHKAMGRSAPARLERARSIAQELEVSTPMLDQVAERTGAAS